MKMDNNDNSSIQQQGQPSNALGKTKRRSGPRSRSSPYKGVTQVSNIWVQASHDPLVTLSRPFYFILVAFLFKRLKSY
jgi:hypothetical protein